MAQHITENPAELDISKGTFALLTMTSFQERFFKMLVIYHVFKSG